MIEVDEVWSNLWSFKKFCEQCSSFDLFIELHTFRPAISAVMRLDTLAKSIFSEFSVDPFAAYNESFGRNLFGLNR